MKLVVRAIIPLMLALAKKMNNRRIVIRVKTIVKHIPPQRNVRKMAAHTTVANQPTKKAVMSPAAAIALTPKIRMKQKIKGGEK